MPKGNLLLASVNVGRQAFWEEINRTVVQRKQTIANGQADSCAGEAFTVGVDVSSSTADKMMFKKDVIRGGNSDCFHTEILRLDAG